MLSRESSILDEIQDEPIECQLEWSGFPIIEFILSKGPKSLCLHVNFDFGYLLHVRISCALSWFST